MVAPKGSVGAAAASGSVLKKVAAKYSEDFYIAGEHEDPEVVEGQYAGLDVGKLDAVAVRFTGDFDANFASWHEAEDEDWCGRLEAVPGRYWAVGHRQGYPVFKLEGGLGEDALRDAVFLVRVNEPDYTQCWVLTKSVVSPTEPSCLIGYCPDVAYNACCR